MNSELGRSLSAVPATEGIAKELARVSGIPRGSVLTVAVLLLGWLLMYGPTYFDLSTSIWATDEQGHGPIILALSAWMLYRKREAIAAAPFSPAPLAGLALFAFGFLAYTLGRSQYIWILEVGSQIPILAGLILYFRGPPALRAAWFTLFFLIFMVPLPGDFVALVTTPLKSAVSTVAASALYQLGYPVGRAGVILTVGPYQLLVADACAGLNSMFTLEALGMLYMNLMSYTSVARNVLLAVLIVPASFIANIVRVMILVLVTYHFGDEAGQGFVHGFAGMVLFMVALTLILFLDKLLGLFIKER
jgi:exosortase B